MADLATSVQTVRERIAVAADRRGRRAADVLLIAVTKTVGVATIQEAAALGLRTFGENRVQEGRDKISAIPGASWHLIGSLQRNKVREAVRLFQVIHSVDSEALAEEISRRAEQQERGRVDVLMQVNVSADPNKHGVESTEAAALVAKAAVLPGLRVRGFMTIGPLVEDPEASRPVFRSLRELRDRVQSSTGVALPELSMGMSDDYEVAIEEGATMVRVGRAIFGERSR